MSTKKDECIITKFLALEVPEKGGKHGTKFQQNSWHRKNAQEHVTSRERFRNRFSKIHVKNLYNPVTVSVQMISPNRIKC